MKFLLLATVTAFVLASAAMATDVVDPALLNAVQ